MPRRLFAVAVFAIIAFAFAACAGSESATNGGSDSQPAAESSKPGPDLEPTREGIKTIQLYRGDERALPILALEGGPPLTLEFDLMEQDGRPLSIYFYHADRNWNRDLSPARFLKSFQNDALINYRPSRGTDVRYTHYTYDFPNEDIRFAVSGNYVLRVTEQGRRDSVLFERTFFVTESTGALNLGVEGVVVSGQRQPSDLPIAQYTPPSGAPSGSFDYATCFVRNSRLSTARCTDRPRLGGAPALRFELPRREAYAPSGADFGLDLSVLRVGRQIERIDRQSRPYRVLLEPDYARFAGTNLQEPLFGQVVVRGAVRNVVDPEVAGEYVTTTFSFVPPNERPVAGEVVVAGSFTDRPVDPDLRLAWVEERGRYEGDVLLKQGLYEYFYASNDPELRRVFEQSLPPRPDRYTAFVYYRDPGLGSDRLMAVGTTRGLQ